jgi:hypothetical protein
VELIPFSCPALSLLHCSRVMFEVASCISKFNAHLERGVAMRRSEAPHFANEERRASHLQENRSVDASETRWWMPSPFRRPTLRCLRSEHPSVRRRQFRLHLSRRPRMLLVSQAVSSRRLCPLPSPKHGSAGSFPSTSARSKDTFRSSRPAGSDLRRNDIGEAAARRA